MTKRTTEGTEGTETRCEGRRVKGGRREAGKGKGVWVGSLHGLMYVDGDRLRAQAQVLERQGY